MKYIYKMENNSARLANNTHNKEEDTDEKHNTYLENGSIDNFDVSSSHPDLSPDDIPTLDQQRDIIKRLLSKSKKSEKVGDKMFVISQSWYDRFFDNNIVNFSLINKINTKSLVVDYDNFILSDHRLNPYTAVPEPVFKKWVQWYGLTLDSKPIHTVLINDSGRLVVEYEQPKIRGHFLIDMQENNHYKSYNSNVSEPIFFTASRLSTVNDIIIKVMDLFYKRESQLDHWNTNLRIWYIKSTSLDEETVDYLEHSYKIDLTSFIDLPLKYLIKKDVYSLTIGEYDSLMIDLVIEVCSSSKQEHWPSNFFIYNKLLPSKGIIGLSNLGNTCYMNSALQCLVHIPELKDYFLYNSFEKEINTENPLGYSGNIAKAFGLLVQSLFSDKYTPLTSYSPKRFNSIVGHYNSMFASYIQQDSQEFLSFLLDGLHEDLNRIVKKPYIEKPELYLNKDVKDLNVIKKLAADTWDKHKLRNDSVVIDLFVGLYKSTLICPKCNNISITFDPYSDLTLPLPITTYWNGKVIIFPHNAPPCILEVELNKTATYQDLKHYISRCSDIEYKNLLGAEIFNHQFYNNYESSNSDSNYLPIGELISHNDIVVFYELPCEKNELIVPVFNTYCEDSYKSAELFGFPFFIALSVEERQCYGAIRKKLEKAYTNFSGGFVEFPITSSTVITSLDSLPLIKQKYPHVESCSYDADLEFISKDMSSNSYFDIKIFSETSRDIDSELHLSFNEKWTPGPHITYSNAINITEKLPAHLIDAYNYSLLVEEYSELNTETSKAINNHTQEKLTDASKTSSIDQVDLQQKLKNAVNYSDMDIDIETEKHSSNQQLNELQALIRPRNAIICEWNHNAFQTVFNESADINWNKPAILENKELKSIRETRSEKDGKKITLEDCLKLFSMPEVLDASDSWYCPNCKEHCQATKQIELWNTPDILIIHLKRFENQHSFSDKIDNIVEFPITDLDMSLFSVYHDKENSTYDLFAVDNHYGGLGGGHYTAYVKNFIDDKWYYFDDSRVNETIPERSIAGSAYLLFYRRRIEKPYLGSNELVDLITKSRACHIESLNAFQKKNIDLYAESKTDSENDSDEFLSFSNHHDNENIVRAGSNITICQNNTNIGTNNEILSPTNEYNISSLEVGDSKSDDNKHDENYGRRKLRLLNKTYLTTSQSSLLGSPASSDFSTSSDEMCPIARKQSFPKKCELPDETI